MQNEYSFPHTGHGFEISDRNFWRQTGQRTRLCLRLSIVSPQPMHFGGKKISQAAVKNLFRDLLFIFRGKAPFGISVADCKGQQYNSILFFSGFFDEKTLLRQTKRGCTLRERV